MIIPLEVHLKREAGERVIWIRLNRVFLDRLRKQLLLWRTFKPEEREKYEKSQYLLKNIGVNSSSDASINIINKKYRFTQF